jgi:hypothetical protein
MARTTLREYLVTLDQVRRQIARVTRLVRKLVGKDEQAQLWHSLPGVGWIRAWTIHAEVGDPGRFKDGRRLASYSLLAPRSDDSGEEDDSTPVGRHVGWNGRLTLKWAFIEAARGAVRKDPRFREFFNRRTENGEKDRNRGHIAVARKLSDVGLACVKKRRPYTATPPPRPGSRPAKANVSISDTSDAILSSCISDTTEVMSKAREKMPGKKNRRASSRDKRRNFRPGMGQPEDPMSDAGEAGAADCL